MGKPTQPPQEEEEEEEEVVASGEALRVVAGWLGVEDAQSVLEQEGLTAELEQGRPQGLGLGAKYVPHHKGLALTVGVEQRLGAKLRRSAAAARESGSGAAASGSGMPAAAGTLTLGARRGWQHHQQQQQHKGSGKAVRPREQDAETAVAHGSSDEESGGRGGAFSSRAPQQARAEGFSRSSLLGASPALPAKRKRRRKSDGAGGSK